VYQRRIDQLYPFDVEVFLRLTDLIPDGLVQVDGYERANHYDSNLAMQGKKGIDMKTVGAATRRAAARARADMLTQ
jgi:hypothetical protein